MMKKLEKLVLQDVTQIPEIEQKALYGGSGYLIINGVNLGWVTDEVVITENAPGYITNTCGLIDNYQSYSGSASVAGWVSFGATILGIFTEGLATLFFAGISAAEGVDAFSRGDQASSLADAIIKLQQMGYNDCNKEIRYYENNGTVKIWDAETGQLLMEY